MCSGASQGYHEARARQKKLAKAKTKKGEKKTRRKSRDEDQGPNDESKEVGDAANAADSDTGAAYIVNFAETTTAAIAFADAATV